MLIKSILGLLFISCIFGYINTKLKNKNHSYILGLISATVVFLAIGLMIVENV